MYTSLVLCGNSTNALITLGALQYLYENGIISNVKKYYATSSGTIISILLIIGYTPLEIINMICFKKIFPNIGFFNFSNVFNGGSLLDFIPIENFLKFLIVDKIGYVPTMNDISTTFGCVFYLTTYNISDGLKEYINTENYPHLSVVDAIKMSCSFPLIFEPFSYQDKLYIDGGFVDNFPVGCTDSKDKCLGIFTKNPLSKLPRDKINMFDFFSNIFLAFVQSISVDKIEKTKHCDFIILNTSMNFFNFSSSNLEIINLFDKGYHLCKEQILIGALKKIEI